MIEFKSVTLADRRFLTTAIFSSKRQDNNLSFANLCAWQFLTYSSFAVIESQLVFRFCFSDAEKVYTFPAGEKAGKEAIRVLARQAETEGLPLCVYGIMPEMQEELEGMFPKVFEYRQDRDHFDYLYLRKNLASLQGKNYQPKRNHVNKFRKTYNYRYTPMTEEMVADCLKMFGKWCALRHCEEEVSLLNERRALEFEMQHFNELRLKGGVLWVEGEVIAFTFGTPVNHNTFCVHAEKALPQYEGAYNMINWEFSNHLPVDYIFLNREEDLGVPGLRQAKLSYYPCRLIEKGVAVCHEVENIYRF